MGIKQSARYIAYLALMDVEEGIHSGEAIRKELAANPLSAEDKGFATRIFYGVLERRNTLDFYLAPYLRRTPDAGVMMILRMIVYQIKYMNVPDAVALDQGVRLCPAIKKSSAKGFVNGSIRGYLREPQPKGFAYIRPLSRQLSIEYSCDEKLAQSLLADWGEQTTRQILASSLDKAPLYIRVNTQKISAERLKEKLEEEGIEVVETPLRDALRLEGKVPVEHLTAFKEGLFHVQDFSSQLCCASVVYGLNRGTVLDLCAAPGGKAFTICEELEDAHPVKAFDVSPARLPKITEGIERLGLRSITVELGDAAVYNEALKGADRVLCDVPCSGFGVIGKKPEIKYKEYETYRSLPVLQLNILENGAQYVKEGGILLYSTCTLLKTENENVVELFLKRHAEYVPHFLPPILNACLHEGKRHMATIFPDDFHSDGFFVAAFRRKEKYE